MGCDAFVEVDPEFEGRKGGGLVRFLRESPHCPIREWSGAGVAHRGAVVYHRVVEVGRPRSRWGKELLRIPRRGRYWEEGCSSLGQRLLVVAYRGELGGLGGPGLAGPKCVGDFLGALVSVLDVLRVGRLQGKGVAPPCSAAVVIRRRGGILGLFVSLDDDRAVIRDGPRRRGGCAVLVVHRSVSINAARGGGGDGCSPCVRGRGRGRGCHGVGGAALGPVVDGGSRPFARCRIAGVGISFARGGAGSRRGPRDRTKDGEGTRCGLGGSGLSGPRDGPGRATAARAVWSASRRVVTRTVVGCRTRASRGVCWAWYPRPMSVSHCLVNGEDREALLQSKDASDRSIEAQGDGAANGVLGSLNRLGGAAGDPRQQRL